jgi:hypothetical protein
VTDDVTLGEVYRGVQNIQQQMVTKGEYQAGQEAVSQRIKAQETALSDERLARAQGDTDVRLEGKETRERLQTVEDRLESRKYGVMIAIALSVAGVVFSIFGQLIIRSIAGG